MLITDKEQLKMYYSEKRLWQGIPSIAISRGGRIFVTFYSGGWREDVGNFSMVLVSDDDGTTFSEPIAVAYLDEDHRCYDPCLWLDPMGRIWFTWGVMPDHALWASVCAKPDANTLTWSEPRIIGYDVMMNKPTVLTTGEWLFPIAVWRKGLCIRGNPKMETKQEERGAFAYKTSDNGESFTKLGAADFPLRDFDEHMILEQRNGVLRMLARTRCGIGESFSYDRGKTWSTAVHSEIKSPSSRFHISRLSSGRVMLINHYNFSGRNNLTVMLSDDDGATWPHKLLLDARSDIAYPDAAEHDGFIYIVYDRERGDEKRSLDDVYADAREILMAKITEEDIIAGKPLNKESRLRITVNRLGEYHGDEPNPFFEIERCSSDAEAAKMLAEHFDKAEIPAKLFDTFSIKCNSMHRVDTERLDRLIEEYERADGISTELIGQMIATIRPSDGTQADTTPIINRIKAVIEEHISEDISANEVSDIVGISRYYMTHLFKKSTGTTITDFKNELRLTKAKKMLIGSNAKISDIAYACGFASSSYFSKKFAESESVSPNRYRKLHR